MPWNASERNDTSACCALFAFHYGLNGNMMMVKQVSAVVPLLGLGLQCPGSYPLPFPVQLSCTRYQSHFKQALHPEGEQHPTEAHSAPATRLVAINIVSGGMEIELSVC